MDVEWRGILVLQVFTDCGRLSFHDLLDVGLVRHVFQGLCKGGVLKGFG